MQALYLPGLDGEARRLSTINDHLPSLRLVPLAYPTGHELSWERMADVVVARLKALGTGLLLGESFGAAVALKTAILRGADVKGLCLISAFSHEPEPFAAALGRAATKMLPRGLLHPIARLLAGWKLAGTLRGEEREKFLAYFEQLDHAELARRLKLLAGFDVDDRLVGVRCPVSLLYGSEDNIAADPRQLVLWQRLPDVRLHQFDGYGHMITQEVPIGVAGRIESWARRVEERDAA